MLYTKESDEYYTDWFSPQVAHLTGARIPGFLIIEAPYAVKRE